MSSANTERDRVGRKRENFNTCCVLSLSFLQKWTFEGRGRGRADYGLIASDDDLAKSSIRGMFTILNYMLLHVHNTVCRACTCMCKTFSLTV